MRKLILVLLFSVLCFAQKPCDVYGQVMGLLNEKLDSQRVLIDNLQSELTAAESQLTWLQERVSQLEDKHGN